MGSLPQLQRLVYCDAADEAWLPSDLPVGPWLGRLTLLGMEAVALAHNPRIAGAATQLRKLCLLGPCTDTHLLALLDTTRRLPYLDRIELHPSWSAASGYVPPYHLFLTRQLLAEAAERKLDRQPPLRYPAIYLPEPQQMLSHAQLLVQLFGPEWA